MKRVKILFANILWVVICFREWLLFQAACCVPQIMQALICRKIVHVNRSTIFGKKYRFASIKTVREFIRSVPISVYDDYRWAISSIKNGKGNVLTKEDIKLLEPTSGSSGVSKLIPYTNTLKREFLCGIRPWLFDLFITHKRILWNTSYWSITPMSHEQVNQDKSVIPIGFGNDGDYFTAIERSLIVQSWAVPLEVGLLKDVENCQYATLLFMLCDTNLAFISVWSPTFMLVLLNKLSVWREVLVTDVAKGTISLPHNTDGRVCNILQSKIMSLPERAQVIRNILSGNCDYAKLWKNLVLVSCWGDANSQQYIKRIQELFPKVCIQPKGLLSTEAFVSLPLTGKEGSVLSIRSHFFEFISRNEGGDVDIKLVSDLDIGETYEVVVTTGGGLYRYKLGDKIRVIGFYKKCPIIKFLGRSQHVSDIVGEKINAIQVEECMQRVFSAYSLKPKFCMIAPEQDEKQRCFYTMFLECAENWSSEVNDGILRDMEIELCNNFHYKYCRETGQLLRLNIFIISSDGMSSYLNRCCHLGQRFGDIKPVALHNKIGWARWFDGWFL